MGGAEDPGNGYKGDAVKQLIYPFVHVNLGLLQDDLCLRDIFLFCGIYPTSLQDGIYHDQTAGLMLPKNNIET
jgi:hypothetical protein